MSFRVNGWMGDRGVPRGFGARGETDNLVPPNIINLVSNFYNLVPSALLERINLEALSMAPGVAAQPYYATDGRMNRRMDGLMVE